MYYFVVLVLWELCVCDCSYQATVSIKNETIIAPSFLVLDICIGGYMWLLMLMPLICCYPLTKNKTKQKKNVRANISYTLKTNKCALKRNYRSIDHFRGHFCYWQQTCSLSYSSIKVHNWATKFGNMCGQTSQTHTALAALRAGRFRVYE